MSKDIIEMECNNFLLHIRNASLHLHLRETKFERGRGIAGRSKLCHRQCHIIAYRQQQGASDMIRESAGGGSHSMRVRAEGVMAGSDGCLGTII